MYIRQTWLDLPSTSTPINASRLNHIEDGLVAIDDAKGVANGLASLGSDGKVPSAQLPPSGVSSVAGRQGDVVVTKTDVGLSNVNNTADSAKPVSTAQAAINALKADLVSGTVPLTQLPTATPNALATLGADGYLLAEQRPPLETTRYFDAGGSASTARPTNYADHIIWYNSPTKPVNGIAGDVYLEPTATIVSPQRPASNVLYQFDTHNLSFTSGATATSITNGVVGGPALTNTGGTPFLINDGTHKFIQFDGVDDKMRADTPATNMPITMMFAGRFRTNAASKVMLASTTQTARGSMAQSATGSKFNMFHDTGINFPSTVSVDTNWHFFCLVWNGTNSAFVVDSVLTSGTVGTATPGIQGLHLATGTDGTTFFDIEIADLIAYNTVIDTAGVTDARAWYKSKHPMLP